MSRIKKIMKGLRKIKLEDKEFIEKMKELGYREDHINDLLQYKKNAAQEGIVISLELFLIEPPISD